MCSLNRMPVAWLLLVGLLREALGDYNVKIISDAPVVSGGVVNFTATIYYDEDPATGSFKFKWMDNAIDRHYREYETKNSTDNWSVEYPAKSNPAGPYIMQVEVIKYMLVVPWPVASQRYWFYLTDTLNGNMNLIQDNEILTSDYVSNTTSVTHQVSLHKADEEYIRKAATIVSTYWFVDCKYKGFTDDFKFVMNYTKADRQHTVDALVLVDFDPLPTEPPTTTTTTTTTPAPTTITPKPTTSTTTSTPNVTKIIQKRSVMSSGIVGKFRGEFLSLNETFPYNESFPFVCTNKTIIPLGPNITYGHFSRNITVQQPVSNIVVTGNNWIQTSDLLQLYVSCNGSSQFTYCYIFKNGVYNVTGNETCVVYDTSDTCHFSIERLFLDLDYDKHTVVIIINNNVNKIVYPVTVTVYKVTKQAQLSVIVVPVAFSLVAVVLIVFGVAYYIQNRSRFIVEIADFNFGQQFADMEYKSFTERLRDSIANAFTRAPIPGSSEAPVWPPGNKYGTMT